MDNYNSARKYNYLTSLLDKFASGRTFLSVTRLAMLAISIALGVNNNASVFGHLVMITAIVVGTLTFAFGYYRFVMNLIARR